MMEHKINLTADADVVAAWRTGLSLGRRLGFGPFKQACLSGAILELSRNVIESGGAGSCVLTDESDSHALRARVVIRGAGSELLGSVKQKLNADVNIGPSLPAVKLRQVVESCDLGEENGGARVSLTIHQARAAVAPGRAPWRETAMLRAWR
jgi:hypothetical protein